MEPKTMERLQKIQELANNIFGSYALDVFTGFEKHDDAGTDVRHNSDGSRPLIKPWQGNGYISDSGKPHLTFNTEYKIWKDAVADWVHISICESY